MTTGQKIKKARTAAGFTQSELANKLGIPFQSISQWERDLRNPKFESLFRIAEALNCEIGDLYDFSVQAEQQRTQDKIKRLKQEIVSASSDEKEELESALSILQESYDDVELAQSLLGGQKEKPATGTGDGLADRIAKFDADLLQLLADFVELAQANPAAAKRFLSFAVQELRSSQQGNRQ